MSSPNQEAEAKLKHVVPVFVSYVSSKECLDSGLLLGELILSVYKGGDANDKVRFW